MVTIYKMTKKKSKGGKPSIVTFTEKKVNVSLDYGVGNCEEIGWKQEEIDKLKKKYMNGLRRE